MTLLTQAVMVRANIDVDRMTAQQKVELADEIYVQQPNLLASILVLPRYGVDMLQLEVPIHVLLVAFQAIKHCGHALPTISEDVQETCLQRLTEPVRRRWQLAGPSLTSGRPLARDGANNACRFPGSMPPPLAGFRKVACPFRQVAIDAVVPAGILPTT
jgi:hypothetical protein